MTTQEQAWQAAEAAIAALAPEASEFASLDAAGFGEATASVLMRAARHPLDLAAAMTRYSASLIRIGPAAAARWFGLDAEPPVPVASDKRFADRTWSDNPAFFAIRQAYLAAVRLNQDVLAAGAGRSQGRPEGGTGDGVPAGRAGADELPALQPGRAQAGLRDRRHQPGGGHGQLPL